MDKIICLGKNYLDHALELGDAIPENPVLFFKPPSVLKTAKVFGETLEIPHLFADEELHHEIELVFSLKHGGFRLSQDQCLDAVQSFTLGLDMTLRDKQSQLKKNGHPWELAKAFPASAIIAPWMSLAEHPSWEEESFLLKVNGEVRQRAQGKQMRLKPSKAISYASQHFMLLKGDLLFSGTPAGVGPIKKGDQAELFFGSRLLCTLKWT